MQTRSNYRNYITIKWKSLFFRPIFSDKFLITIHKNEMKFEIIELYVVFSQTKTSLSAINQGDAWIPNFLIKYANDNSTPVHCVMIDFQLAR